MNQNSARPFLVVLGMHRSGTSLLARMCNLLGADIGPDVLPPAPDNPAGFWEHRRIVELNDRILGTLGLAWNDPFSLPEGWTANASVQTLAGKARQIVGEDFADSEIPVIKDPRLCRLVPLWGPLLESSGFFPRYLIVSRSPLDVERSLASRNGFPPARSYLLWLHHMLEAEHATRGQPRAFLSYEALLRDWRSSLRTSWERLDLAWPDTGSFGPEIDAFLNPELRHHETPPELLESQPQLARFLGRAYQVFRQAEQGSVTDAPGLQTDFDSVRRELDEILFLFDPVLDNLRIRGSGLAEGAQQREREARDLAAERLESIGQLQSVLDTTTNERDAARQAHQQARLEIESLRQQQAQDIRTREQEIQAREQEIEQILQSRSWQITAPLRSLSTRWQTRPRLWRRHTLKRAWTLLRNEGPRALWKKMRVHTGLGMAPLETIYYDPLPTEFPPLNFPEAHAPEVSIVVPAYNQFAYTYNCLRSLAGHATRYRFEVIVVDDASSDGTAGRLESSAHLCVIRQPVNRGFIHACNEGARQARGDHLVFLNNDTQIQEGWLDHLIETFDLRPDAGAVGSRLIYPDGRLQEAGGIVWRDGSGWNLGRLDDPHRPEYSYLRVVDYCSGASLAIRRETFERLGGFDEYFLPAYYEDTDLCFRIRANGARVYYQPLSRVVHFEGVTSGTDTGDSRSVKQHQVINQKRFAERWYEELQQHRPPGQEPEREKERDVQRRALIVDACMLTPDQDSGSLRMFNLIRVFQELGYKVTFAPLNLERRQPYTATLQKHGVECLYAPYQRSVDRHLQDQGHLYDMVLLSRADVADELVDATRRNAPSATLVFDTVDLHYLRERREAELKDDARLRARAEQRRQQETALIRSADKTFVVSAAEKEILDREIPGQSIHVVSNVHDIEGRRAEFEEREGILFVGGFAHPPNVDAVAFLAEEIQPRVQKRLPGTVFHIVGSNPPPAVIARDSEAIRVHGFVPDLEPWLDQVRMTIAPLRYGAGVKGKINLSLAHGVPVVGTSVATEGMHLEHERSALIADDPDAFADAVVRLYTDRSLWTTLSDHGIAIMQEHFSVDAARHALRTALAPTEALS